MPAAPAYLGDRRLIAPETFDAISAVLGRLETLVEAETAMLRAHRHAGLTDSTRQKRQGLLEMNRLMRALENTVPSQELIARLAAFRVKLAANDAALKVEMRAAQAVTATVVRVMREIESDGTYSRSLGLVDAHQGAHHGARPDSRYDLD